MTKNPTAKSPTTWAVLSLIACLGYGCGDQQGSSGSDSNTQKQGQTVTPDVLAVNTADSPRTRANGEIPAIGDAIAEALAEELGNSMQEAFDEQMRVQALGGTPEQIAAKRALYDAAQTMPRSVVEAAWMAPVELQGKTIGEVLTGLVDGSGIDLDLTAFRKATAEKCSVDLAGKSRAQALEEITAQLQMVPVYPQDNPWSEEAPTMTFKKGPRKLPVTFAGPFVIEIKDLIESTPYGAGNIRLVANGLGLSRAMQCANQSMDQWFQIESVLDANGNTLASNPDVRMLSQPQYVGRVMQLETEVDLNGLLRSVQEIAQFTGTLHLQFPVQVNEGTYFQMQPGEKKVGALMVNLTKAGIENRVEVDLGEHLNKKVEILWAPENLDGEPLGIVHDSSFAFQGKLDANMTTSEIPNSLKVKLVQTEPANLSFQMPSIPLANHKGQPESVTKLKFKPAQPLSVVFVEFSERDTEFPKVQLRSVNHSNKDVRSVQVELSYLNDQSKTIKEFFTTLNAAFQGGESMPLVRAGESVITVETAFFMPTEADAVQIRVIEVEFMDRTRWEGDR